MILNGGLCDSAAIGAHLREGSTARWSGRAAYHRPALLAELEQGLIDPRGRFRSPGRSSSAWCPMPNACAQRGMRLHSITRHMHGVMAGREGARAWRRFLSEVAARPEAAPETLFSALPITQTGIGSVIGLKRLNADVKYNWLAMGKEIEVAIVFADVVGSTKLYELLGDLRARDMVGICIDVMRAATEQNHGTVIKTMGDEVMATFPTADDALNAAAQMQKQIATASRAQSR